MVLGVGVALGEVGFFYCEVVGFGVIVGEDDFVWFGIECCGELFL